MMTALERVDVAYTLITGPANGYTWSRTRTPGKAGGAARHAARGQ
ncbi:hypothetical protein OG241_09060 [Streptomyces sp. NBC_01390]